jgi:hypothetical protein
LACRGGREAAVAGRPANENRARRRGKCQRGLRRCVQSSR